MNCGLTSKILLEAGWADGFEPASSHRRKIDILGKGFCMITSWVPDLHTQRMGGQS
jgi:hypothetical protein